jgi:hypothetical protein
MLDAYAALPLQPVVIDNAAALVYTSHYHVCEYVHNHGTAGPLLDP